MLFYEIKVNYQRQTGEDNPSNVKETYLVEGFTPADVEQRLMEEIKPLIFGVRALMENYVEVAHKNQKDDKRSIFDLGPVNTFISNNFVDGLRLRLAGRTMAALNPHFFWDGYGAYGTKSHEWYYGDRKSVV